MHSRAVRLTLGAAAWIALAAAAFFFINTEQSLSQRRDTLRSFDDGAARASAALSEARAGVKSYVAVGQSPAFWGPKVAQSLQDVGTNVDRLRGLAASAAAQRALMNVSAATTEFSAIDTRVRDYVRAEQMLMAGDVAFSESDEAAQRASTALETARLEERRTFDAEEQANRLRAAYAAAAAAGLTGIILIAMLFGGAVEDSEDIAQMRAKDSAELASRLVEELDLRPARPVSSAVDPPQAAQGSLKEVAELCTALSLMQETGDLQTLLARAARLLNAGGLVVWLGDPAGADLRPIAGHGYSEQVLALMRTVPRMADNATAAAYRSGLLQVVGASGASSGAIVVPLLSAEGCVGALTAEIRDGSESSPQVQAVATIVAAQLSTALAPLAAGAMPRQRSASA